MAAEKGEKGEKEGPAQKKKAKNLSVSAKSSNFAPAFRARYARRMRYV